MTTSATDSLRAPRTNPLARWGIGDNCASERLSRPICIPHYTPSFQISAANDVFAIGSCFARNVEEQLAIHHRQPLSLHFEIPGTEITAVRRTGLLNKFNSRSILQELTWASGEEEYPDAGFLQKRGGGHYDPHLRRSIGEGDLEELKNRRRHVREYFSRAFSADIVILTLGLAECWQDESTGLTLTEAPDPYTVKLEPDRYTFGLTSSEAVLGDLVAIRELFRRHGKDGCRFVVTTSPVAMGRTFTDHDILVANMHSKSLLRVAALQFAQMCEGVDYFPSYEGAMLSDRRVVWEDDQRHVSDFFVGQLIAEFLARYGLDVERVQYHQAADERGTLISELRRTVDAHKSSILQLNRELADARTAARER